MKNFTMLFFVSILMFASYNTNAQITGTQLPATINGVTVSLSGYDTEINQSYNLCVPVDGYSYVNNLTFTNTFTFSSPVNAVTISLTAVDANQVIFFTPNIGTVTIVETTSSIPGSSCLDAFNINSNAIGAVTGTGQTDRFNQRLVITGSVPFTSLVINGSQINSSSIMFEGDGLVTACAAGGDAPQFGN